MPLTKLIERFELAADVPGAIQALRKAVLALAVTGRLVEQNSQDEPADILLKNTDEERRHLISLKKIKGRKSSPIQADEMPFAIPKSWRWARLLDVGHELGQKVPNKKFTYIDVGGIDSNQGAISNRVEVLEHQNAPSRARKLVSYGTVLYSTVRPYLLNIAIVDRSITPEPIASTAFGVLHPFSGVNNRYLFYWLRSDPFTAYVNSEMKGMAYPAINDEKFYGGPIALPPAEEQKRIVAKVDELMALCDQLEAQQQERTHQHAALSRAALTRFTAEPTPDNLTALFQPTWPTTPADLRGAILTAAVSGRLCHGIANEEPICQSALEFATNPKQAKRIKKYLELETEPDFATPPHWKWFNLGQIASTITDGTHHTPKYQASGVPFISIKDLDGKTVNFDDCKFISEEEHLSINARCNPEVGDILICRIGTLGRATIVDTSDRFSIFVSVGLLKVPHQIAVPEYLKICLDAPFMYQQYEDIKAGGSHTNKLNLSDLPKLQLALPPLEEQHRIVTKVNHLMILVDDLERQQAEAQATGERLLAALVAECTGTPAAMPSTATTLRAKPSTSTTTAPTASAPAPKRRGRKPSTPSPEAAQATETLLAILRERGTLTNADAQAATGLDAATIRTHLKTLVATGHARTEGQRRGMRYIATSQS